MYNRSSHIDAISQNTNQASCFLSGTKCPVLGSIVLEAFRIPKYAWPDRHEKVLRCTWWMVRTHGPSDITPFSVDDIKLCAIFRGLYSFGSQFVNTNNCPIIVAGH